MVDGGTGTGDKLSLTLGAGNDKVRVAKRQAGGLTATINGKDQTVTGIEKLDLDAGAGADVIELGDLSGSLSEVKISLGRIATVVGTKSTTQTMGGNVVTLEEPDIRYADDRAKDTLSVEGTNGVDDVDVTTPTTGVTHVTMGTSYIIDIDQGIRAEGDTLTLMGLGGGDEIDAHTTTQNLLALVLQGGTGNDRLIGSRYDDVIDGGEDNDTCHRWRGPRHLPRRQPAATPSSSPSTVDFFLSDDLFVVGTVHEKAPGTDFDSGVVEDLDGLFENVELTGGGAVNTFLVGDLDGVLRIGALSRDVRAGPAIWRSRPAAATTCSWSPPGPRPARRCTCTARAAPTAWSCTAPASARTSSSTSTVAPRHDHLPASRAPTPPRSTHDTVEGVRIETFAGSDRVLVHRIAVPYTIWTGIGDDEIAVGTNGAFGGRRGASRRSPTPVAASTPSTPRCSSSTAATAPTPSGSTTPATTTTNTGTLTGDQGRPGSTCSPASTTSPSRGSRSTSGPATTR